MYKRSVRPRNVQPFMTHITLPLRSALTKVARAQDISLSECGRRALQEFVERETPPKQVLMANNVES